MEWVPGHLASRSRDTSCWVWQVMLGVNQLTRNGGLQSLQSQVITGELQWRDGSAGRHALQ